LTCPAISSSSGSLLAIVAGETCSGEVGTNGIGNLTSSLEEGGDEQTLLISGKGLVDGSSGYLVCDIGDS
jgi:hypothetical protein